MGQYNIFISWSQEPSRTVAAVVKKWLKQVVQATNAFYSEEGINSGEIGFLEIADQLEAIRVGVFIVTEENQYRPWLNYEAGAISKGKRANKVMPLLFDFSEDAELEPPLSNFQYRNLFYQDQMLKFVQDVAKEIDADIEGEELKEAFERLWPDLHAKLTKIKNEQKPKAKKNPRELTEKIDELLTTVRGMATQLSKTEPSTPRLYGTSEGAEEYVTTLRHKYLYGSLREMTAFELYLANELFGSTERSQLSILNSEADYETAQNHALERARVLRSHRVVQAQQSPTPPIHDSYLDGESDEDY